MQREFEDQFIDELLACQSRLYRFIATMVVNWSDAEELFQQTGLEAWRYREMYDPDREFFPWLCGIARNHVRRYYRSRKAAPLHLADEVVDQLAERQLTEEPLAERRQRALQHCLQKLPARQRRFVQQFYEKRQTVKAFAAEQTISRAAAYKLLQRVRGALFDCINRALVETDLC